MNGRDEILLRDMLDEARTAQEFIAGHTRSDLDTNKQLAYALVRAIEVVGEAVSQISQTTRSHYSQIPWKNIIGMRNRIVHGYRSVNLDIVWEVATRNLLDLIAELEQLL